MGDKEKERKNIVDDRYIHGMDWFAVDDLKESNQLDKG